MICGSDYCVGGGDRSLKHSASLSRLVHHEGFDHVEAIIVCRANITNKVEYRHDQIRQYRKVEGGIAPSPDNVIAVTKKYSKRCQSLYDGGTGFCKTISTRNITSSC